MHIKAIVVCNESNIKILLIDKGISFFKYVKIYLSEVERLVVDTFTVEVYCNDIILVANEILKGLDLLLVKCKDEGYLDALVRSQVYIGIPEESSFLIVDTSKAELFERINVSEESTFTYEDLMSFIDKSNDVLMLSMLKKGLEL